MKTKLPNTHQRKLVEEPQKSSVIKLGLDVHADSVSVVRQIDGALPQPAQRFTWPRFWAWVEKQVHLAGKVYSCYEAGPFGYGAHRRLTEMGVENIVVRPQDWDELSKGVKTDKADALALCQRLDRYVGGNTKAFAVVHVPTEEEEISRSGSRLREQIRGHRQRAEAQGRSMMLYYGVREKGRWWAPRRWAQIRAALPEAVRALVEVFARLAQLHDETLKEITVEIEKEAQENRPKGYGKLTAEVVQREVVDWGRFKNRRQIASMTGLCPGVHSSGNRRQQRAVTKHGNPRLRKALIELAWRIIRYQPDYLPVKRWLSKLATPQAGTRKKAVVAIARHLAIDLWRIHTGRVKGQELGLIMNGELN
jgi:transposase